MSESLTSPAGLSGLRILLVEDTMIVSAELVRLLEKWSCSVNGPHATLEEAMEAAAKDSKLDGALLDINLQGKRVFPLAERLVAAGVPLVFMSGYSTEMIPPAMRECASLEKPFNGSQLAAAMVRTFVSPARASPAAPTTKDQPGPEQIPGRTAEPQSSVKPEVVVRPFDISRHAAPGTTGMRPE